MLHGPLIRRRTADSANRGDGVRVEVTQSTPASLRADLVR